MMNKTSLKIKTVLSLAMLIPMCSSLQAQVANGQLSAKWRASKEYNAHDNLGLVVVLKNEKNETVRLDKGDIFFNSMFPVIPSQNDKFSISDEKGNLFRIRFADGVELKAKDSIVLNYASRWPITNISVAPVGFYYQDRVDHSKFYNIPLAVSSIKSAPAEQNKFWAQLYDYNQVRTESNVSKLILPTPQSLVVGEGKLTLTGTVSCWADDAFHGESASFNDFAAGFTKVRFVQGGADSQVKIVHTAGYSKEGYGLTIDKSGIRIEATESTGAFYALQSLRSLLSASDFTASSVVFPFVTIKDEPRYAYRGLMMDISRNFKSKETVLKYLDLMAHLKLNTFHFHFIDDEGWRIEIAKLPELTQIGAKRSPNFQGGQAIQPGYGSGATLTESQYLTRQDFVEILRYAKQRHITVVPEIETPGHARASIKAMEARYHRYMKEGNEAEATKYLLNDFDDQSVYNSAQNFKDNIMNVALPSVYTFIGVVLDEFKSMYSDAGLTLTKVSLGADEVPNGSWEKSPKIQELMAKENYKTVYEVWPYYINKVNELCHDRGIQMAGWEEMGMVNEGKGMVVNKALSDHNIQLDVWNNLVGAGQEDLAYRLANAGYETVFISANNNYFDMAWSTNFDEPGLKWATYADLYQSYAFLPENFFSTIDFSFNGAKFPAGHFNDKVRLTEEGKKHLVGIKGGLWAETVHSPEALDYMIFPRIFALAERAWAPRKSYEDDARFKRADLDRDYNEFINKLGRNELPKIDGFVKFRLPAVGVKEINGVLHANTELPGFDIHYTTDGKTPTANSTKYVKPIAVKAGQTVTFVTIGKDKRTSLPTVFKK